MFAELGRLLLCALLGFAAVDAGVAWLDRRQAPADEGLYLKDPVLGFTNRPHFHNPATHLDRFGLRNEELPVAAPHDELRILGLGASLTYGAGVPQEQTWSYDLEARLNSGAQGGGPRVSVLNGGVMGYSLLQACRRGLALLPLVDPDLVIVFVDPGRQSLLDRSDALRWERVGDENVPLDVVEGLPPTLRPLAASLHDVLNFSALYRRYRTLVLKPGKPDTSNGKFLISRATPAPEVGELLGRSFGEARALVEAAAARGVQVRFLLYPEWEQCNDPAWTRFLQAQAGRGAPPLGTPRDEPMEVLAERLEAQGGECWSIFDLISGFTHDTDRYLLPNEHWTAAGHAEVAEDIAERLVAEGLLPRLSAARRERPR